MAERERDESPREPVWLDLLPVQQPDPYVGGYVCQGCGGRVRFSMAEECGDKSCRAILCDSCIESQDGFHCDSQWLAWLERYEQRIEDPGAAWRTGSRGGLD